MPPDQAHTAAIIGELHRVPDKLRDTYLSVEPCADRVEPLDEQGLTIGITHLSS